MEENAPVIPAVTIQPKTVYGLRTDVIGNIHFNLKQEVIYPVEGVLAFHDYTTNKQKFLRFPENTDPLIIALSPNRRLLAVLEWYHNEGRESSTIVVYELASLKKRRTIPVPTNNELKEIKIHSISFTSDSKAMIVLAKPPDETIFMFLFDKSDTVLQGRATNPNVRGSAECIASNPTDSSLLAIAGDNLFKLVQKSEKGFTLSSNMKPDGTYITSIAWLSAEAVVAGSNKGCLLFIENSEVKARYDALRVENVDLMKSAENEDQGADAASELTITVTSSESGIDGIENRVLCMTVFPRGFAYSVFNRVYVFEKESKYRYGRKTILTLPLGIYPEPTYCITNLAVNHQQDTVIVTARHAQIYVGILIVPESLKTKNLEFKDLGEPLHIDEIIDMSICSWRPVVMTASKDQTVRIWNYETGKIELVKKYQVDVYVIELNPNGLFAAVGFSDQLRIMEIFMDDLQIMKTYNFPRCRDVVYSNFGHLMAAAHENLIAITSVYNLEVIRMLKGHNADVMSVAWTHDDKYLISGGIEGAVYQWDVDTGARIHEVVQKGVEYRSLQVTHDPLSIYAVTSMGTLREMLNSEVVREIKPPSNAPLLAATLARSDLVMFISSAEGHLYNVQLPFLDAGGGTCTNYRFFHSAVTKLKISHDGTLLITASRNGTLAIWVMKNLEGRICQMDQDLLKCTEILVPRKVLIDKSETIATLELRMQQQVDEFQYQQAQNEIFDNLQLEEIHKGYCTAIEELKEKNNDMETKHVTELNLITDQIKELKAEHQQDMNSLATQFSERMLVEYQKSQTLRANMIEMRESYEEKLRKSAGCLQDTIEALEIDFKKQLQERQELIRQLMQEMEDKKIEFVEYCRQVEMDNDRNMVESQLQYEKKLKNEQDETLKWRGEAGVLKKKYNTMSKETEELMEDIDTLKQEHAKYKKEIASHLQNIEELKKEISERDFALVDKERRIQEVQHKNQELEKYKQVLTHKISELKSQIEPRERQIKEKRHQIAEMERELEGLHSNNLQFELQLAEMKDKYLGSETELRIERQRSRLARNHISRICGEIYEVSGYINRPDLLKNGVKQLFQKYSNDTELKKSILLDAQVSNEFQRQREHIEKMAESCKKTDDKKKESLAVKKLVNENVILLEELNNLRRQNKDAQKTIANMESLLGVSWRLTSAPVARMKLEKAVADYDKIQEDHSAEVDMLRRQIEVLTNENKGLKNQINEKQQTKTFEGGDVE